MEYGDLLQAFNWYNVQGYDLQTIADHYALTVEQLKTEFKSLNS